MNTKQLSLVLAIIFFVGIAGVIYIYSTYQVLEYREIPITYSVKNGSIGFDISNETLTFGQAAPGGRNFRSIVIETAVPARFVIGIQGAAQRDVRPEPPEGIVVPGVPATIRFTLSAPMTEGNYSGLAQIRIFRR